MKQRLQRAMPFVFGFGLVLATVLLLMPSHTVPRAFDFYDKTQHGLMFTALAVAGLWAYPNFVKLVCWGLFLYGGLMEVLQSTITTTRYGDWFDWLTDGAGVCVGFGIFLMSKKLLLIATNKIAN